MSGTNFRATQVGTEYLSYATPAMRASAVGTEYLTTVSNFGSAFVSQSGLEVLTFASPIMRASAVGLEILYIVVPLLRPAHIPVSVESTMFAPRWYLLSRPVFMQGGPPVFCVPHDPDIFCVPCDP